MHNFMYLAQRRRQEFSFASPPLAAPVDRRAGEVKRQTDGRPTDA